MELYIVRHAEAVEVGAAGVTRDPDRYLTPEGRAEAARAGRGLKKLGAQPQRVFSSPFPRAEQTASALLTGADLQGPIELRPELRPGATPLGIVGLLTGRAMDVSSVLIVGHNPDLPRFIGSLIGHDGAVLFFPPAGIARVDVQPPKAGWKGRLVWLLGPRDLGCLGVE